MLQVLTELMLTGSCYCSRVAVHCSAACRTLLALRLLLQTRMVYCKGQAPQAAADPAAAASHGHQHSCKHKQHNMITALYVFVD
jgi:hypothetical protein